MIILIPYQFIWYMPNFEHSNCTMKSCQCETIVLKEANTEWCGEVGEWPVFPFQRYKFHWIFPMNFNGTYWPTLPWLMLLFTVSTTQHLQSMLGGEGGGEIEVGRWGDTYMSNNCTCVKTLMLIDYPYFYQAWSIICSWHCFFLVTNIK